MPWKSEHPLQKKKQQPVDNKESNLRLVLSTCLSVVCLVLETLHMPLLTELTKRQDYQQSRLKSFFRKSMVDTTALSANTIVHWGAC